MTKFYTNVHTGRVYKNTGHDVTGSFPLVIIQVQRMCENAESVGFAAVLYLVNCSAKITKFFRPIQADMPYICTGYEVTMYL